MNASTIFPVGSWYSNSRTNNEMINLIYEYFINNLSIFSTSNDESIDLAGISMGFLLSKSIKY